MMVMMVTMSFLSNLESERYLAAALLLGAAEIGALMTGRLSELGGSLLTRGHGDINANAEGRGNAGGDRVGNQTSRQRSRSTTLMGLEERRTRAQVRSAAFVMGRAVAEWARA